MPAGVPGASPVPHPRAAGTRGVSCPASAGCGYKERVLTQLPWPVRSILSGTAGTAALTLAYAVERHLRGQAQRPLDYDDSLVPGQIVVSILHLPHVTGHEENDLGLALRWSYGSMFGLAHGLMRRRWHEPAATAVFDAILMSATLSLFPLLGRTPPPWRWPPAVLATSMATHAVYAATVGVVDDRSRRGARSVRLNGLLRSEQGSR
ncbi:MAG: hypothetical protein QOF83_3587 [Solirubrobacteraceae bacterium]|nr:hypothetical protein [Solirubrobacteraceae bacterium]